MAASVYIPTLILYECHKKKISTEFLLIPSFISLKYSTKEIPELSLYYLTEDLRIMPIYIYIYILFPALEILSNLQLHIL